MVILTSKQKGYTLIELMIVIGIIAVITAIAYPSYQQYVIKGKRGEMMTELHNMASRIESRRLADGAYTNIPINTVLGSVATSGEISYPNVDARYNVSIWNVGVNPATQMTGTNLTTARWEIRAVPVANTGQVPDGSLAVDYKGQKCRRSITYTKPDGSTDVKDLCGQDDEWRANP